MQPVTLRPFEVTALHAVGLLLWPYTGRICMFDQSAEALFQTFESQLVERLLPSVQTHFDKLDPTELLVP